MSLNHKVVYGPPNKDNFNNPLAIMDYLKPSRIVVNNVNPLTTSGEDRWYYINSATGDFFEKSGGQWYLIYNFDTGGGGGGISNIENDGTGAGIFRQIIGSTAHFKSIVPAATQLIITDSGDELRLSINGTYKPDTLSDVNNKYFGGGASSPVGVIGSAQGASVGSFWAQTPNKLWICTDPASSSWALASSGVGIVSNINLGFGGGKVFKSTDGAGVASFRTIAGTVDQINVGENADDVILSMNNNYKPNTLFKVTNVLNNFDGSQPAPTAINDESQGYQAGSVWVSGGDLYICTNAANSAAVWSIVGGGSVVDHDLIDVYIDTGNPQTSFSGSNISTKLNIGNSVPVALSRGSWSATSSGFGAVITRISPTNGIINNKYLVNYSITLFIASNPAIDRRYDIGFGLGNGANPSLGHIIGSASAAIFPPSSFYASVSGSFIFNTTTAAPVSFFPFIIARSAADPVAIQILTITTTEI